MFRTLFGKPNIEIDVNSTTVLASVVFLHIIGPQAVIVQPAFVDGLVSQLAFTPAEAGYIAATENTGKAIGTVLMMFIIMRFNWRHLYYLALSVLIAGNIICMYLDSYSAFRVVRFCTGMANGMVIPLCYVILGLTAKQDRNYGLAIMTLLIYAALVFLVLPTVFGIVGFKGLVGFFAGFSLLGMFLVRNMPTAGSAQRTVEKDAVDLPWPYRGSALAAMFLYFLGMVAVWAYLSLIGKNAATDQQVAYAMTVSQFVGIAGAFTTVAVAARFGRSIPLISGFLATVAAMLILVGIPSALGFVIAACIYQYAWNMTHPYLLAAQASFDRSGRQVSYAVAMQMTGVAAGPAIAAAIIARGGSYEHIVSVSIGALVLGLALILPPVLKQRRLTNVPPDDYLPERSPLE